MKMFGVALVVGLLVLGYRLEKRWPVAGFVLGLAALAVVAVFW